MHPSTWEIPKDASLIADLAIRLLKRQHKPDQRRLHWRALNSLDAARQFEECHQYGVSFLSLYPDYGGGYSDVGASMYRAFIKNPKGPQARKYADAAIKALTHLKQRFPEEYKIPSSQAWHRRSAALVLRRLPR
jgi:hypothetical protein